MTGVQTCALPISRSKGRGADDDDELAVYREVALYDLYNRFTPPPLWRTVMRPKLLRPTWRWRPQVRDFSGLVRVTIPRHSMKSA